MERTRRGKAFRARAGMVNVLCGAPYGFRYVRRTELCEARYEVIEDEARVVREVFGRYTEEQASIGELARWLTNEEIPTHTGKDRWDRSVIWAMLRNPAYAGRAAFLKTGTTDRRPAINRQGRLQGRSISRHYAKFERPKQDWITIAVPAIITEATFALAERRLAENRRFAARNSKEPSLLMGLAACQSCGYAYYRTSTRTAKRKIYYYRCLGSDDYRYPGGRVCDNKPVRADYLDGLVWGQVTALLADPALVQGELDRRLREMRAANPATSERARLERDYTRATKRKLANLPARPTPPEGGLPRYGAELKAVREGRADHACSWSMIILITSLDGDMVELEHWFRERAQVEERLKDSKYGAALRHLPSGHKVVNAVWTWSAFLALNISAVLSAFARLAPAPATGGGSPGTDATSPSGQGRRRRHQGPLRATANGCDGR